MAFRRDGIKSLLLLACTCTGLSAVIYLEWASFARPPAPVRLTGGQRIEMPSLAVARTFAMKPAPTFTAITDRPAFSPTRRPPKKEIVSDDKPLTATLVGVILSRNERIALFTQAGSNVLRLREEEQLDGWTLVKIEPARVTFVRTNTEVQLALEGRFTRPLAERNAPQPPPLGSEGDDLLKKAKQEVDL